MKVLVATNNAGKVERLKKLLKWMNSDVELYTPAETGIESVDAQETGTTLMENAELKARAYREKTDLPILSNDSGFYVEGEGLVDAPKRKALGDIDENTLTQEEITKKLLNFWKGIATKYGGAVNAALVDAFVVSYPDGTIKKADSRREVILTDQEFGVAHPQVPVRALYYSKATNKPALHHTEKEDMLEMQPVIDALRSIFT